MLGFRDRTLSADELVERARRKTGFDEFGDTPFYEGLERFLQACNNEADLSLFGVFGTRWDCVRFLSNLLQLRRREINEPEILDQPIERPIFIAGVPRSGTTYLHQLLTNDPHNRVPRIWQLIHPYPGSTRDRRKKRVARQLRMFKLLAPEFHRLHPVGADSPQECSEITAHVFTSRRFDTNYFVPSYRRWVDQTGHLDAYRFHKRFLRHLQYQAGGSGRWVLKCPDHVFALGAIRAVYPDARFVFVHRDPARVLLSVTRLTEVLRRPFARHVDRAQLGRDVAGRWLVGTNLMIRAADEEPFAEPIFHIDYETLVCNPIGAVARLYRHFGLHLDDATADRIRVSTEVHPNGGYADAGRYNFEAYGLDPALEQARYEAYVKRFNIPAEQKPKRRSSARLPHLVASGVSE
jgi:sulfotransferase family protein